MTRWLRVWLALAIATLAASSASAADKSGFTPFTDRHPGTILEGNWQSCVEDDQSWGERVYDHYERGVGIFELHMGPRHEFALFRGVQDAHRGHAAPENLLWPHHEVVGVGEQMGTRTWRALGYTIRATLAGGSLGDCESFFITIQRRRQ